MLSYALEFAAGEFGSRSLLYRQKENSNLLHLQVHFLCGAEKSNQVGKWFSPTEGRCTEKGKGEIAGSLVVRKIQRQKMKFECRTLLDNGFSVFE